MDEKTEEAYYRSCVSENVSGEFHACECTSLYTKSISEECQEHGETHVVWRRNLALVYRDDRPGKISFFVMV